MNRAEAMEKALSTARALALGITMPPLNPAYSNLFPVCTDFLVEHDAILNWKRPIKPLPALDNKRLTERERAVVALAAAGMSALQISRKLNITAGTVKIHLKHARLKI